MYATCVHIVDIDYIACVTGCFVNTGLYQSEQLCSGCSNVRDIKKALHKITLTDETYTRWLPYDLTEDKYSNGGDLYEHLVVTSTY